MNEIKVAENKTLKLTNVLSRLVRPEELGNLPVILTQMQNFMTVSYTHLTLPTIA